MKHSWKILAVMALMPVAVMAQTNLDSEVNAELEKMYKEQATATQAQAASANSGVQTQAAQQAAPAAPAAVVAAPVAAAPAVQPTVVQTQTVVAPATATVSAAPAVQAAVSAPAAPAAVVQPTTVIEASPLTESGAEKLRKARQEAELYTEQNIVQKLEQSRLEDEKKRADVLFGDKFNQLNNQQNAQAAPAVVAAPVAVQQVAAPVADNKVDKEQIRNEVNAALADLKPKEEEKPKGQSYVGLLGGGGSYPDAKNVRGQYSAGVSVGRKFDEHLVLEGTFIYSNFEVDQSQTSGCYMDYSGNCYPRITNMNQYAGQALVKYQLFGGNFHPEIGAVGAYTYRTFSDSQFAISNSSASSNALDAGLMTGASMELTDKFSVGLDFRYMWNLTYKTSGLQTSFQQSFMNSTSPIETMNYYTVNMVGRMAF